MIETKDYIGNISQCMEVQDYIGEDNVRFISVASNNGISFTVVVDRGLDLSALRFRGVNISYLAPCGVRNPRGYTYISKRFEETFFGGMLTTCGLENTGPESVSEKVVHPMHGSYNHTIAENIQIQQGFDHGVPYVMITGTVAPDSPTCHGLELKRTITIKDDEATVKIHDEVLNNNTERQQVCIMYHYNFGFPFLCEDAILKIPSLSTGFKNSFAEKDKENMLVVTPPDKSYIPKVYYHSFGSGENSVRIENPKLGITADIHFSGKSLRFMNQWKMFAKQTYVLALEPCNALPFGRQRQREMGVAQFIEPLEHIEFDMSLHFLDVQHDEQ